MSDNEDAGFDGAHDDLGLGPEAAQIPCDVFDLELLERRDKEFEEFELQRGVPEQCVEASRDFCFLCVYGDQGEAGTDRESRQMLATVREFSDFVRRNVATYTIVAACVRIKTHYERNIRKLIRGDNKPTFTYMNIAKHVLEHDASIENVVLVDAQTHARLLGVLRKRMLDTSGGVNSAAVRDYISVSHNFHRHLAGGKKRNGTGLA